MKATPMQFPVTRLLAAALLFASACLADDAIPAQAHLSSAAVVAAEGFETGTKGSYAAADVALPTGTWNLDDALIGNLAGDAKSGTRSVRLRNSGRVTTQFDVSTGVSTVSLGVARYGSDATGTIAVYWSSNGGGSWTQAGSTVTVSATSLVTATFPVNRAGSVRIQIRKTDGGAGRLNVDDVSISDYASNPDPDPDPDPDPGSPGADVSVHTALGLPSAASASNWDDYLAVKSQFVVAYNSGRKVPNWVSWELNSTYLGSASRQDDYRADSALPSGMPQASLADYRGSGYDRGHMCPSGDRTKTTAANSQTFLLSNMLPQASNNNGGPWDKLEAYGRTLVGQGKQVYVVAGGTFHGSNQTIGSGVAVPDETWKVMVVLNAGGAAGDVTTSTRVIAIIVPNDDGDVSRSDDWRPYRVSVDTIEAATGLDLLSDVAPSVESVIEARVDNL